MKVEIDVPVTEIVAKTLIEDWQMLKTDIENLKTLRKSRPLENFEMADLKDFKKFKKATETMIRYYLPYEEYTKVLGEENE